VRRFELDLIDFFYDISIPAEIREATQAGLESDICMVTLSYAAAADADVAPWLATELVQRWHAGRVKSLLVLVKLASEYGVEFDNVLPNDPRAVCWEELLAQEELPDLGAARRRTQTMVSQLNEIIEHANQQPDGVSLAGFLWRSSGRLNKSVASGFLKRSSELVRQPRRSGEGLWRRLAATPSQQLFARVLDYGQSDDQRAAVLEHLESI